MIRLHLVIQGNSSECAPTEYSSLFQLMIIAAEDDLKKIFFKEDDLKKIFFKEDDLKKIFFKEDDLKKIFFREDGLTRKKMIWGYWKKCHDFWCLRKN